MSWLNTDSTHVCSVAILADPDHCPWRAARVCYEHQIDFNYVTVDQIASLPVQYKVFLQDGDLHQVPTRIDPYLFDGDAEKFIAFLRTHVHDVEVDPPAPSLRIRHVVKDGDDFYFFFNESRQPVTTEIRLPASGNIRWIDMETGEGTQAQAPLLIQFTGYQMKLLTVIKMRARLQSLHRWGAGRSADRPLARRLRTTG